MGDLGPRVPPTMPHASHALRILAAGTLLLTLAVPSGTASTTGSLYETFEEETLVNPPTSPYYTFSATAENALVATTQAHGGTKSLSMEDLGTGSILAFDWGAAGAGIVNFCLAQKLTFWYRIDSYPSAGNRDEFLLGTAYNQASAFMSMDSAGLLSMTSGAATPANTGKTMPLNSWVDFTIWGEMAAGSFSTICLNSNATIRFCMSSQTLVYNACATLTTQMAGATATMDTFVYNPTGSGRISYFDDILPSATLPIPGSRFCADPTLGASADWGYDYKEDVTFEGSTPATISLGDGFLFELSNGDNGYLGKGFSTGSTGFRMNARIEAGSESSGSLVRLAYTTGATALAAGSTNDLTTDATAAGNGQNTGNFANNVQAVFTEESDHWNIALKAATGGGSLTTLFGGSANYNANPNNPHTFAFLVNTAQAIAQVYQVGSDGNLSTLIISANIPAGLQDASLKDAWIIATGQDLLLDADTAVDDSDDDGDNDDSTCIFDLVGTSVVTGSGGILPGSQVPDVVEDDEEEQATCTTALCVDSTNVPPGFTAATLNAFLGVLLVAGIAVGGTVGIYGEQPKQKISGAVVGGFLGLGYLVALYFGLLPMWPIVAAVVIMAGAVIMKPRSGG